MIEVEVWSDFVCPFCYIGKRNFDLALAQFPEKDQVQVVFKSFELDPSARKSQTVSIHEYLAKKFGRPVEWAKQQNERVTQMAAGSGLTYHMDKAIPNNSFDAHQLSHLALQKGLQLEALERIFSAYFTEGKDISNLATLMDLAAQIGLDPKEAEQALKSQTFSQAVREDETEAQELGISGVPFFVFNQKFAVSGAQPQEVFLEALAKAKEK